MLSPQKKSPLRAFHHRPTLGGFTLIELLTVIAIIGILAAIIVPTVSRVRKTARKTQCASNMRQIATAMLLYTNDHRGQLPVCETIYPSHKQRWDAALCAYLNIPMTSNGDKSLSAVPLFKCPEDPRALVDPADSTKWARSYSLMRANNTSAQQWDDGIGIFYASGTDYRSRNLAQLAFPSKSVLFTEIFTDAAGNIQTNNLQYAGTFMITTAWVANGGKSTGRLANGEYYHGSVINFAFADGHIESTHPKNINTSAFNHFRAW